ncbi:MAG TPA: DUF2971 domain-containing protein [Nitrospira sp.]|nr:DUF2971 domain-containing protein [Nitrospira sp.]
MNALYHYCSTSAFHAIVESHAIWLSALSLSNDIMEGKVVADTIASLAKRASIDDRSVHEIQKALGFLEELVEGLGFCLSEDGDLLSQWRGYAVDATGVAIGFSTEYLNKLSDSSKNQTLPGFSLARVEYDIPSQESHIKPTFDEIYKICQSGALQGLRPDSILGKGKTEEELMREALSFKQGINSMFARVLALLPELFRLKSLAFKEEREWRLISYFIKYGADYCEYRAIKDRIIPYRKFELTQACGNPIVEVILGPKHTTPMKLVEKFLEQNQYRGVIVRRSKASYR